MAAVLVVLVILIMLLIPLHHLHPPPLFLQLIILLILLLILFPLPSPLFLIPLHILTLECFVLVEATELFFPLLLRYLTAVDAVRVTPRQPCEKCREAGGQRGLLLLRNTRARRSPSSAAVAALASALAAATMAVRTRAAATLTAARFPAPLGMPATVRPLPRPLVLAASTGHITATSNPAMASSTAVTAFIIGAAGIEWLFTWLASALFVTWTTARIAALTVANWWSSAREPRSARSRGMWWWTHSPSAICL
mmetsp:Transcript_10837/g.28962  ORF Transcript_10837/g.28962 Transcript_10837/m.28962 type:complete len:253 (+) Transcript_10837:135-893(+)